MPQYDPLPTADHPSGFSLWLQSTFAAGWTRAWSWWAAAGGLTFTFSPDVINMVLERWTAIALLPGFSLRTKLILCVAALIAVVVLRPLRQGNIPPIIEAVARFYVPRTVQIETAPGRRVSVAAQVIPVDDGHPLPDATQGRVL